MVSFMDIAPATETIDVAGVPVEVTGISAKGLASLFGRFPNLLALFSGGAANVDIPEIAALGSDIVAAIIAAGVGYPGNREAEEKAALLPLELQLQIMAAIKRQTLPGGVENFMALLKQIGVDLEESSQQPLSNTLNSARPQNGPEAQSYDLSNTSQSPSSIS